MIFLVDTKQGHHWGPSYRHLKSNFRLKSSFFEKSAQNPWTAFKCSRLIELTGITRCGVNGKTKHENSTLFAIPPKNCTYDWLTNTLIFWRSPYTKCSVHLRLKEKKLTTSSNPWLIFYMQSLPAFGASVDISMTSNGDYAFYLLKTDRFKPIFVFREFSRNFEKSLVGVTTSFVLVSNFIVFLSELGAKF